MKFINKKSCLFVCLFSVVLFISIYFIEDSKLISCRYYPEYGYSIKYCDNTMLALMPFCLALLFVLITYPMKEQVFQKWIRFAIWYVPLLAIATPLLPTSIPGSFISGFYQGTFNALALIVLYSVFVIVSILRIVQAYSKTKNK